METSANIIRKQSIDFTYNGKTDAFVLQKEISDWCTFSLIPEIEQQLESLALDDQYITIEKLDLDATVNQEDWKQKIKDELLISLNRKLSSYKHVYQKDEVKREAVLQKLDELILYYFEKGFLPWWSKAFVTNNFETVLQIWITENMQPARAEKIAVQLQQIVSGPVVERILNRLPGNLIFQFLKNIYKSEAELLNQASWFFEEVIYNRITASKQKAVAKPVYHFILNMMFSHAGHFNTGEVLWFLYTEIKKHKPATVLLTPDAAKTEKVLNPVKKGWEQLLTDEKAAGQKKIAQPEDTKIRLRYNKVIDKLTTEKTAAYQKTGEQSILQEGIFIDNAGAVIIAAFLPAFFEKLKLAINGTVVNPESAALIIQYAVSGNTKSEEYDLVLPKILCGIHLETPLNTGKKISAAQKREADEMLLSVIEYWAVIKNTSINGLRESFLKRSGKLSFVNNEWLLQVEQKSYDMLLEQLPWSISMIRLPWMKNLLRTGWV